MWISGWVWVLTIAVVTCDQTPPLVEKCCTSKVLEGYSSHKDPNSLPKANVPYRTSHSAKFLLNPSSIKQQYWSSEKANSCSYPFGKLQPRFGYRFSQFGAPNLFLFPSNKFHKKNSKAVPLQAWSDPEGPRKLRFPDFMTVQEGGKIVRLKHRPHLPQGNSPGTHFCLRLSRPQGHSAIWRIMSMKNSNDTIWNRTSDRPICSTAP